MTSEVNSAAEDSPIIDMLDQLLRVGSMWILRDVGVSK